MRSQGYLKVYKEGVNASSSMETVEPSKDSEWAYVHKSKIHDTGLFAFKDIPKGTKVIEFRGEKISKDESVRRLEEEPIKEELMHIFELDDDHDVDGGVDGSDAIYLNHSCEPNLEVDDEGNELWFYAIRDIRKGEELTFDYNVAFTLDVLKEGCRCGSPNCRGCIINEEDLDKVHRILEEEEISPEDMEYLKKLLDKKTMTEGFLKELRELMHID